MPTLMAYQLTKCWLMEVFSINVMPQIMLRTLQRSKKELIPTEINVQGFTSVPARTKGILPVELRVGTKTSMTAFFVVETTATYNALLGRDWIHPNFCIPSTLHQFLIFWNRVEVEVISADSKPFMVRVHSTEALLYEDHIGPVKLIGINKHGGPKSFTFLKDQALDAKAAYDDNDRISLVTPIIIDEEVLNGTTLSEI